MIVAHGSRVKEQLVNDQRRICTFCDRGEIEARAAANGHVCGDCMRAALEQRDGFVVVTTDGSAPHRCLFCGISASGGTLERNALIAKESSVVCMDCLALARRILP